MAWRRTSGSIQCIAAFAFVCVWLGRTLGAVEPLHVRIDQHVEQASLGALADNATDGEFLRRIYLDLLGTVPPSDVARAFLDDKSPDKRVAVVDRLLQTPQHARHLASVFDVVLMERRPEKHVKRAEWEAYLLKSFSENKPWDQLAREILGADGTDEKVRAATAFYLFRDGELNLLTRDTARVFFGMDLQCCQCHDHPLIDDYYQADYYGIYAFLSRGFLFTAKDKKVFFAEKATGDVKFTSVFTKENGRTGPRLPGDVPIDEPVFAAGEEYSVKPVGKVRPVPKHSRRAKLAELATNGENDAFNRNIVNRLWSHMLGRGIVDPVDLHHPLNAAAHPALLKMLADDFVAMKYDIRAFLRELALTRTYQLALKRPNSLTAQTKMAAQQLTELEKQRGPAEKKLSASVKQTSAARKVFNDAQTAALAVADEHTKAKGVVSVAQKKYDAAAKKLSDANAALAKNVDIAQALTTAAEKAKLAVASLPEEKELAAAAAIIAARADKLSKDVAAAEKKANGLKPTLMSTTTALENAKKAGTEVATRLAMENQKLATTRPPVREAIALMVAEQSALAQLESRIAFATELSDLGKLQATADVAASSVAMMDAELANGRKELDQLKQGMVPLQTLVVDTRAMYDKATAGLNQVKQETTAKQVAVTLVAAAAAAAEVASGKLPKDAELKKAADSVKSRSTALAGELSALQKQSVEQQEMASALAEKLATATTQLDTATKRSDELTKAVPSLEAQLPPLKTKSQQAGMLVAASQEELLDGWNERFFASPVVPLTPEQMAWSLMQVTGVRQQQRTVAVAEVNKSLPIDSKNPDDPARLAAREVAISKAVHAKLVTNVKKFIELFGHAGGQPQIEFFATVDQALFFSNAGTVQTWLKPDAGNLTDRLNKLEESAAIAEELYISVLTRRPTSEEVSDVTSYLKERPKEKLAAVQEMAWGLMTSVEFRFSY
jgi:predicted  nucleic acid-binding Zn-ribbon protein